MKFCASSGSGEKLSAAFQSMTLSDMASGNNNSTFIASEKSSLLVSQNGNASVPSPSSITSSEQINASSSQSASTTPNTTSLTTSSKTLIKTPGTSNGEDHALANRNAELSLIISAMRKIRESLTATRRTDLFAQRAYLFILRATILTRQWESYLPCLNALLFKIHPVNPIPQTELSEIIDWYITDIACRQNDLAGAYAARSNLVKNRYSSSITQSVGRDPIKRPIDDILQSVVRDDWLLWRRTIVSVDGFLRNLMSFADEKMRLNSLKIIGRSYLKIERDVLELWTGTSWSELVKQGVGWELDNSEQTWVVVRKIKGKTS